jgi:3-methylfumaryl-CoA hydratase
MAPANLQDWIGREEVREDFAARGPYDRLNAMLDRPAEENALPPLGHWLCFLPEAPQAQLGVDGHPERGGIVPPIPLPMRMFAGSRLEFHAPIPFGAQVRRVSRIMDIKEKAGRTGPLAFLTTRHQVFAGPTLCVIETVDVVFRKRSGNAAALPPGERRKAQVSRTIKPEAALLFRYSALTYKAHRIH